MGLGIRQSAKYLVWPLEEMEIKAVRSSTGDAEGLTQVGDHLFAQVRGHVVLHIYPVHTVAGE